ncbi:MAG: ABC transporter permease, partial [Lacticaseibacillus paracasei]|nr:ABC transporter permease [Lacticaseibacillus paracasei]
ITNVYLTAFIVMAAGLLPVMLTRLFHFLWFLPMPYLDSYATLSGTLVDRLNQPLASVVIGTGLLFLWTFVNLFIFGLRVKKEAA